MAQSRTFRLLCAVLAAGLLIGAPPPARASTPAADRLADQLASAASLVVSNDPLVIQMVRAALLIAREAARVDPDDPDNWRLVLEMADLAERESLQLETLTRLVRLQPHDEALRLRFIHHAIDRRQTVEDRTAVYERLLSPSVLDQLGPAVASRIAADYATLLQRTGDTAGFTRWIAEAVALDPSNREAAATAAGFFRLNVDDPFAEAELLVTLLLADPAAQQTQVSLGRLLLEQGCYPAADRMYAMAASYIEVLGDSPPGGFVADWALSRWGRGDTAAALEIIAERQQFLDGARRRAARRENPDLSPMEAVQLPSVPLEATLATVRAAILQRMGSAAARDAYLGAVASYEREIAALASRTPPDPAAAARRGLEAAWVALWIGADVDRAGRFLDAAMELLPADNLDAEARARFEGWMALRVGDRERAAELLEPLAAGDPVAALGLAITRLGQGHLSDGARTLLDLARRRPGSLIGIWSADMLREMVGMAPEPGARARQLQSLIDSIPSVVDRFATEPTLAFSVRVRPTRITFDPFEPILVEVEVTNNAPFPLAIDPGGPIRPHVALFPDARVSGYPKLGAVRPTIVEIDRRLRLEPHERLVVTVDLRRSSLQSMLGRVPLPGATLTVRGITNFVATPAGTVRAGILGAEVETAPFRVDGARLTSAWMAQALATAQSPHTPEALSTLALLAHAVARFAAQGDSAAPQAKEAMTDGLAALEHAYDLLEPIQQAWLIGALPGAEIVRPLRDKAGRSEDRDVRLAYLLHSLQGPDDPVLKAALADPDPTVRGVAELMKLGLQWAARE